MCRSDIESQRDPFSGRAIGLCDQIFRRAQIRKDDWVAIVGTGFLGTILLQLCAEAGAKGHRDFTSPSALHLAERMGAHLTFSLENRATSCEAVRNATGGSICKVVIEAARCTGDIGFGQ